MTARSRRVAVLHDSPAFGGHERAFLTWLPEILACPEVTQVATWIPRENASLLAALAELEGSKLQIVPHGFVKGRAEPLRAPFRQAYQAAVRDFIKASEADLTLLLQGRVENLAVPMLSLPKEAEVVSYVPMAHGAAEMRRGGLAAPLIDALKRPYYARPNRWIVPANAVAAQLERAGVRAPIYVVDNVPGENMKTKEISRDIRMSLGIDQKRKLALFMGRFDTAQKGIDRLLRDLQAAGRSVPGWSFLFVGEGPGESMIRSFADFHENVHVMPWTQRPEEVLAAADVILLPSRFEGVPLILLEALQGATPVLASDIDVFREFLPSEFRRDFSRPVDLTAALDLVGGEDYRIRFERHAREIAGRLDPARSRRAFVDALLGRTPHPPEASRRPSL